MSCAAVSQTLIWPQIIPTENEPQTPYRAGYQIPYLDPGTDCYGKVSGESYSTGNTSDIPGSAIPNEAYPQNQYHGICSGKTKATGNATRRPYEPPQSSSIGKPLTISTDSGTVRSPKMEGKDMDQFSGISTSRLDDASGVPRASYIAQMPHETHRIVPAPQNWPNFGRPSQDMASPLRQAAIPYQAPWPIAKVPQLNYSPRNVVSYTYNPKLVGDCESTLVHPILASHIGQGPNRGWRNKHSTQGLYSDPTNTELGEPHSLMDHAVLASRNDALEVPGLERSPPTHSCATSYNADSATMNDQRSSSSPRMSRGEKIHPTVIIGRKKRTLSPNGRDHAKRVRRFPGGACDICKRKKTKCTHRLPEDQPQLSSPMTPFTDVPTPEEELPVFVPNVLSPYMDANYGLEDVYNP